MALPRRGFPAARCGHSRGRTGIRTARGFRARARSRGAPRDPLRSSRARSCGEQLGEVGDDDVGAVLAQGLRLSAAVDSDHASNPAGAAGLHAGQCVLEDRRLRGFDAKLASGGEEGVGRRLSAQALALRYDAVDAELQELIQTGGVDDVPAVGARGDDGAAQPRVARGLEVAARALVWLDAVLTDQPQDDLVLSVAEAVDRVRAGVVVRASLRQLDAPGGKKVPDPVVARLAVDVCVVVVVGVEGNEPITAALGPAAQVIVEHLLPRGGMDLRGLGEDTVEVE